MKTVMVIDDDVATLDMIDAVLSEAGYRTVLLPTSEDVPEKVASEKPDLILLDILIEPKHGMEVLESLSEMRNAPPVILISAAVRGVKEMHNIAKGLGCYDFIEKPFDVDDLLATVEGALEKERV
ncbi:MAG: response regulator [Chloroflexota bacterium]